MKSVFLILAAALLASCACLSHEAPAAEATPIYGWLVGNCLALPDHGVHAPRDFSLVDFEHGQQRIHGIVLRKAVGQDHCPALLPDRRDVNAASGNAFYVVKLDSRSDLGIGIVGRVPAEPLSFGHCTTSEGIRFTVTRGSHLVWSGYYYLGYDVETTCARPDDQ